MDPIDEAARYHAALVELAGEYGCVLRVPMDPSQPPQGTACRDRDPGDEAAEWCYACVASEALYGS